MFEQDIDLSEAAVFGLWQTEPAPNVAEKVGASIEETGFRAPVPC